jgi:hypothetical protein
MKREHIFIGNSVEVKKGKRYWDVVCKNTGGSFNTIIYTRGFKKNVCPCCKRYIRF